MNGPFETERQARDAAHAAIAPEDGWSILLRPQNRLLLERACQAAGVGLGAYDARILDWLSGFEDSICAVVAGLISRATAGSDAAVHLADVRRVLDGFDWEHGDRQYALEQIDQITEGDNA